MFAQIFMPFTGAITPLLQLQTIVTPLPSTIAPLPSVPLQLQTITVTPPSPAPLPQETLSTVVTTTQIPPVIVAAPGVAPSEIPTAAAPSLIEAGIPTWGWILLAGAGLFLIGKKRIKSKTKSKRRR